MAIVLALVLLVTACDMTPKQARREIVEMGLRYDKASFAECVAKGDSVCLDLFLLAGMDPNTTTTGYTMLEHADGDAVMVARLLQAGAWPDSGGVSTPLIVAITNGGEAAVDLLLSAGADAGLADGTGRTALMAASERGDHTLVNLLLTAGANINARSRLGATALSLARGEGHDELAALLRAAGAVEAGGANLEALMDPASLNRQAPERFEVGVQTSAGDFRVEVVRQWAPHGADRFYNLVTNGFFDQQRFFRVVRDRLVQFGLHGQPEVSARWYEASIPDDPASQSNKVGTLVFATGGSPDSRTTQVFINLEDNVDFDSTGLTPFGRVTQGLDVVSNLYAQYGELPQQARILSQGDDYLDRNFPRLDTILQARLITAGD